MPVRKLQSYEVDYQKELSPSKFLAIRIMHPNHNLMPISKEILFLLISLFLYLYCYL